MDDGYKAILHVLAVNGPQYLWNITKLSKDAHGAWQIDQRSLYRRVMGSSKLFSLIEKEYILPQPYSSKKSGSPKIVYALTLKGMLAVLSTGITVEQISQYRDYVNFVCSKTDDKNIRHLIEDYIKNQMYVFLCWHTLHGIQLQKQTGSNEYFSYFFKNFSYLSITQKDKRYIQVYRQSLKNYLVVHKVLSILDYIADSNKEITLAGETKSIRNKLYTLFTSMFQFDYEVLSFQNNNMTVDFFQKSGETFIGLIQK